MCDVTLQDHLQNGAAPTDADESGDTNAHSTKSLTSNNLANSDDQSTNNCFIRCRALLVHDVR